VIHIQAVIQGSVPPEVIGALVAQVFAVETDLVVAFSHRGPVSGHDAVISQERGDHVDKVGPREGMNGWDKWTVCYFTRAGAGRHDEKWHRR
jgi:hypothetical protein